MSNERTASEEQAINTIIDMSIQYRLLVRRLDVIQDLNQHIGSNTYRLAIHHLNLAVHHARELVMDLIQESFIYYVREEQSLREVISFDQYYAMWEFMINDPGEKDPEKEHTYANH